MATSDKSFGQLLSKMIADSDFSNREFYEKLNIKKVYFYDIIKGRMKPPPKEKQFEIIKILKPDNKTCREFFSRAAEERGEFPADLELLISDEMKKDLRKSNDYQRLLEKWKQG